MTLNDTPCNTARAGSTFLPAAPAQRLLRQQAADQAGDLSALAQVLRLNRIHALPGAESGPVALRHRRPDRRLSGPTPERAVAGVVPDPRRRRPCGSTANRPRRATCR